MACFRAWARLGISALDTIGTATCRARSLSGRDPVERSVWDEGINVELSDLPSGAHGRRGRARVALGVRQAIGLAAVSCGAALVDSLVGSIGGPCGVSCTRRGTALDEYHQSFLLVHRPLVFMRAASKSGTKPPTHGTGMLGPALLLRRCPRSQVQTARCCST